MAQTGRGHQPQVRSYLARKGNWPQAEDPKRQRALSQEHRSAKRPPTSSQRSETAPKETGNHKSPESTPKRRCLKATRQKGPKTERVTGRQNDPSKIYDIGPWALHFNTHLPLGFQPLEPQRRRGLCGGETYWHKHSPPKKRLFTRDAVSRLVSYGRTPED